MNKAHSGAIVLDLEGVDEGRNVINFAVTAAGIELADPYFQFPSPIEVDLLINRSLHTLSVKASVRFALVGECCRCTGCAEENVKADFDFLIQHMVATLEELEAMEEDEDVVIVDPGKHELDLTGRIREAAVLELPMRVYCRHDCRGLCPQCGQNLNGGECQCVELKVDPRWEALAKLNVQQ